MLHCAPSQKAAAEAEQRASELASLNRQQASLAGSHDAAAKEMDALHAAAASAGRRADEALAELALVRESQGALTAQVGFFPNNCAAAHNLALVLETPSAL